MQTVNLGYDKPLERVANAEKRKVLYETKKRSFELGFKSLTNYYGDIKSGRWYLGKA